MKKIIILAEPSDEDRMLVDCLQILFPECQIEVCSKQMNDFKDFSTKSEYTVNKER